MKFAVVLSMISLFLFSSCNPDKKQIGELLKKNPELVTDVIKEHPAQFIEALNAAVKDAQSSQRKKQEEEEKKKFEESFNNPLKPELSDNMVTWGPKDAELVLVEYSDFECPFCSRGYQTVQQLMKKYDGKIKFVYKHLPLSFHPNAMPAAQYYEALALQSHEKAQKFHDELFDNFSKIKNGESFFKSVAKKLGADMGKLATDLKSETVKARIDADMAEAKKYGIQGTPGFVFNGIPVKGAYPASHFDMIVEELKKRGKVNL